jgi:AcrR family transcriptional regulator
MSRPIPPDRLPQLVARATEVFIEHGYQRTQMADVAAALGVAKGTLYLYVESKEALFDLAVRSADVAQPFVTPPSLPVPTPPPGATLTYVREQLAQGQQLPALTAALSRQRVTTVRAELEEIVGELYDTLARNRQGIKLLDRSARDYPELAALWFDGARGGLIVLLSQYLETRIRRRLFRPFPDVAATARLLIETTVWWAVHRHWDSHSPKVDDATARATVLDFILNALTKEDAS